ncbi:hypothetical protein PIROE2DRAFT_62820 [Piromyces sp. E2]|nr:hypothetical protein PIROE2DRAFT_62820 [Piromyces sp. E2]|eukprot:OUM60951.1 hypothetical protein PIROE2DRAFT_62820 [Piromyces sp. E2]
MAEDGFENIIEISTFKFQVVDVTQLPLTLKFVYKSESENEPVSTAEVTLNSEIQTVSDGKVTHLVIEENGGNFNIEVDQDDALIISLNGKSNTGNKWTFVNSDELNGIKEILEYSNCEEIAENDYVNETCDYKFQVVDVSQLPLTLKFVYKNESESEPVSTAEVTLNSEIQTVSDGKATHLVIEENGGNFNIEVDQDDALIISLNGKSNTGNKWTFVNNDELNGIKEILEYSNCEEIAENDYVNETCNYKFQIVDVTQLPLTLKLK